ncbi:transmembrane protein, putative, partial [Bodo saltans]
MRAICVNLEAVYKSINELKAFTEISIVFIGTTSSSMDTDVATNPSTYNLIQITADRSEKFGKKLLQTIAQDATPAMKVALEHPLTVHMSSNPRAMDYMYMSLVELGRLPVLIVEAAAVAAIAIYPTVNGLKKYHTSKEMRGIAMEALDRLFFQDMPVDSIVKDFLIRNGVILLSIYRDAPPGGKFCPTRDTYQQSTASPAMLLMLLAWAGFPFGVIGSLSLLEEWVASTVRVVADLLHRRKQLTALAVSKVFVRGGPQ